jgi:isoleucyl-tRNA synthetase
MEALKKLEAQLLEELNVKSLEFLPKGSDLSKRHDLLVTTEGDHTVAIEVELSPELQAEGMAREIVRRLQTMRRAAGFDIADHIITYYQGGDYIKQVMADFADYIKQETLSRQLIDRIPEEGVFTERHKLDDYDILLGVKRLT